MKRLILNSFLFALLSTVVVSCSKEEVKPFAGNGANSGVNSFTQRGTDDASEEESIDNEDTTGDGITDGGNSSDYDSKGTKKKDKKTN